ncbi:hypothetical protein B0H14DRAFT_3856588 [Mycena olivaceomarginata]|nr:hypothetical protein B0H14DRAFT_3856588 [Mycena olivaceomarginata]
MFFSCAFLPCAPPCAFYRFAANAFHPRCLPLDVSPPRPPHRRSRASVYRSPRAPLRREAWRCPYQEAGEFACGCHGGGVVQRRTGRCCG